MNIIQKLNYFRALKELDDGTNVSWFIYNLKKQGVSDKDIVRQLLIKNNMVVNAM